jgi:hypothetical protein
MPMPGNVISLIQQWIVKPAYNMQNCWLANGLKSIHPDIKHTTDSWINAVKTGTTHEVECRILNKELGLDGTFQERYL